MDVDKNFLYVTLFASEVLYLCSSVAKKS